MLATVDAFAQWAEAVISAGWGPSCHAAGRWLGGGLWRLGRLGVRLAVGLTLLMLAWRVALWAWGVS